MQRVRASIAAFRYTPALAGSIAIGGALANWLWWALALPPLPPITWPTSPSSPLASLCLLLLGSALVLRRSPAQPQRQRRLGIALALAAALVASLALAQIITGRDVGIDTLLFRDAILRARALSPAGGRIPGRTGGSSALTILALSVALLTIHHRQTRLRWVSCIATLAALAITIGALMFYMLSAGAENSIVAAPMTAGKAMLFAALSVGVLFVYRQDGIIGLMFEQNAAGLIMRRLVLATLLMTPLIGWSFHIATSQYGVEPTTAIAAAIVGGITIGVGLTVWSATSTRQLDERRAAAELGLQQLAEQRRHLLDVGQSLVSVLAAETIVARLRMALPAVTRHSWFGLYELDEAAGVMRPILEVGGNGQGAQTVRWSIPLDRSISADAVRERRALLVNHAERDPRSVYPPGMTVVIEHLIAAPLLRNDAVFGIFLIARNADPPFSEAEFEGAQFLASYVALALSNARLYAQATGSEELAREREEMLRAIGDNLPTGVIYQLVRESEGAIRYTYISSTVERLGMTADELYANPNRPATLIHPEDDARYQEVVRRAFRELKPIDIEVRRFRPDGRLVWHHITNQPRRLPSGQVVWDGITYDITERKRAEAELQAANDALQQRVGELAALGRIAQSLAQWVDLPTAMREAAVALREVFDGATIVLWQIDEPHETMRLLATSGGDSAAMAAHRSVFAMPPSLDTIAQAGTVRQLPDFLGLMPNIAHEAAGLAGYPLILVPLLALGQPVGLMAVHSVQPGREFTPEELAVAETVASSLANAIDNARLLAQAQATAAEEERRRIARDLHDSVSQALFSAARIAATLPQTWELDPEEGRDALGELRRLTGAALAEMRALLVELRPRDLVEAPLHEVLAHLVPLITSRSTAAIHTRLDPAPLLPADVQVALYRLTQEALNNVSKHAHARLVTVTLDTSPAYAPGERWLGSVTLRVADDGRGFDPEQRRHGHLGLALMRERAATIGARLTLESRAGAGTQVTVCWQGEVSAAAGASAIIGRDAATPLNGGRQWTADQADVTSRPR